MDEEQNFDDEPQMQRPRQRALPANPLFFIVIGIVIGFLLSTLLSPDFLESFSNPIKFTGEITEINKWVSDDLRTNQVILRINDANVATCIDDDACLGYAVGDSINVTCIGIECRATKRG